MDGHLGEESLCWRLFKAPMTLSLSNNSGQESLSTIHFQYLNLPEMTGVFQSTSQRLLSHSGQSQGSAITLLLAINTATVELLLTQHYKSAR